MSYKKSLYITGEWCEGTSFVDNINPSDISESIGQFPQASEAQLDDAMNSATAAQVQWNAKPLEHKVQVLQNIGDELIARCDELGELLASEEGKPFAEARGEIYRSGQFFQYYAAEVLRQIGDLATSVRAGVQVAVTREPVGVVGIISPWNFPTATAAWKIAPALAFGNAVIWKPANLTPASAVELTKIIAKQDIPKGLFNLVLGSGQSIGNALINSNNIQALSFTGSVETGQKVATATAANFVKCQLEMGSKNALYIASDACIETALQASIAGAYSGAGQKCTASSRLIVDAKIYDEFTQKLLEKVKALKIGHALSKDIFMGPVVSKEQLQSNLQWVENIKQNGGELLCGGEQLSLEWDGYYMSPALFINTENHWQANQEEIFAPLACVIKVNDLEEAIHTVNDTKFGLSSGIITQSLKSSAVFQQQVKTGCVMVNLPTAGTDYHVPFGGRKQSSFGVREQGQYAQEFYTAVKTAYIKP